MTQDYIDFQDRTSPLAYFITFSCYGARLHGDERGTKDRRRYNKYGTPEISATQKWSEHETSLLRNPPVKLNDKQRPVIENAIREVCTYRDYLLHAVHVRTNHVHTVVSGDVKPEKIMDSFKSYATRHLRRLGLIDSDVRMWARHGSTVYLWTEESIEIAVDYVLNCQGEELQNFDLRKD